MNHNSKKRIWKAMGAVGLLFGLAMPSWAAPILEYDFYQSGTTTVVAAFTYNGFVNPGNLPANGFIGFINPPSPLGLVPCNLNWGPSSAELTCSSGGANSPLFDFNFAGGAFPSVTGAFSGNGLLIGDQSVPSLTTTALANGRIFQTDGPPPPSSVPEPGTYLLTSLGLGLVALTNRNHRLRWLSIAGWRGRSSS